MKDIQFVKNNEGKNLLNKEMISYAAKWVPRKRRSLSSKNRNNISYRKNIPIFINIIRD